MGRALEEADLHAAIARILYESNIAFTHEYRLGPRCRPDFYAGGIVIEVKKSRPAAALLKRQIERYLSFDEVKGLIVVTQKRVTLPDSINNKPVRQIALDRLWGVSLP